MEESDTTDVVDQAVENLEENDIAEFIMKSVYGELSDEPRTLKGRFPGEYNRAMGHAIEVLEIADDHGLEAEREYIGECEELDGFHVIAIHIEGGDPSWDQ